MIYKANVERKIALYGTFDIDRPYPKNCPIKKDKNKRLYHVSKLIDFKAHVGIERAISVILSY